MKMVGGTGFQPVPLFQKKKRNLPHWQEPGRVYFITWRCQKHKLLQPAERTITLDAIKFLDQRKWIVFAAVIMPDHVHVLGQPHFNADKGAISLSEILHSIKNFSSHAINKLANSRGSIWQDESFDRIIRDDNEFMEKWQYIRNNPVTARLVDQSESYPWLYERQDNCTGQRPVPPTIET